MTDRADIYALSLAGKSWDRDRLQGSMQTGLDFEPEAYAHAMKLAAQHRVEPSAVLDDPKYYERANKINAALSLVDTHPKTAQWLGMPDHVALGQDDIPNLKKIEEHFTGSTTGLSQSQWKAVLEDRARATQENFGKSEAGSILANTNAALASIPALGYRILGTALAYPEAGFRALGDVLWNYQNENVSALANKVVNEFKNAGGSETFAGRLGSVGDKVISAIERPRKVGPFQMLLDPETRQPFKNPDYSTWVGRDTLNTIESAPGQLASFIAGGEFTPVLMALDAAHAKQRSAVQEMQAQHPDTPLTLEEETKALVEGWGSGLLNYGVMGLMPQPVKVQSVGGAVAQGVGRATLLGTGLTAFENLISKLHDPERDTMQGWQQGLVGMGLWEGLGTYHQIRQVRENMQMLDGLEDLSKSSKLNARMREKFEEVIKHNADGTGNEHVRIPAEAFTAYFQSVGESPSAVAEALEIPNFKEAIVSGGDLLIPVEKWTTRIANTHHAESLIQDVRFQPDQPTIRELRNAAEQTQEIKETSVPESTELEKFEAKRKAQLEAAGYKPDVADAQAKLHAEVFRTLGESEGLTADQMDQMFHLDITGYRGETKKGVLDVALDRLKEFGQGAKEYFQGKNDRKARAQEKMRRSLSPSGQGAELNRRGDEVKASEAEFAAFDTAVKEIQGGDILSDKRGFTQVLPGRRFHIGLLAGRDLSTFLHESGHYFLEVMGDLAERPEASERIKAMWGETRKALGVESRDQIETKHHEQFAKQFERYLMEGKAPSEATRGIFQRFKNWMKIVYRELDRIGVRLNDDVRSVFDRLIAMDDEIEARRSKAPDLFATPEDMGETPEVFKIYTDAKAAHLAEAHERVDNETLWDLQREQSAEFKAEEETVKREVAAGIDSRPDIKALAAIEDPKSEIKLNRKEVEEQFGTSEGLPTVEEGGMDADSAAEILGFESGTKLVKALLDAPDKNALVNEIARQIMIDRHGDMLLDGTVAEKAIDALENDKRAEYLSAELKALRQLQRVADKVGRAKDRQAQIEQRAEDAEIPSVNSFRLAAAAFISDTSLRNMNAHEHRMASEKYSQLAYDLKGKKQYGEAAEAKQKELLNHFLYLEARKAQAEGKKIRIMARNGFKADFQSMLGLAGESFQNAYNEILRGYEFDNISGVKLDERRAALADLQRLHEEDGIDFDPALLNQAPRNYREVPMSELRAVADALKNIETVAKAQREIDIAGQKVAFDRIRAIFMTQTPDTEKTKLHRENDKVSPGERIAAWARGGDAGLLKVEWMADRFDRGDINGPMRTFILNLINDANGKKLDLGASIYERIKDLVGARSKDDLKREMRQTGVQFPSQTTEMTHQQLISWALNLGTAENRNVALNGEGLVNGDGGLSPMVDQALSKLTESDCRFIQGVWDVLESLRPLIAEKERRVKGIEPKWKETTPFQINTADGKTVQMRGGYYPLAADRNTTDVGRNQGDPLALMGAGSWSRVKVAEGFTKQVTGATYHLRLDYPAVLSEHLNDVITNVTCGEAVAAVNKIITNPDIRMAMSEKLGPEYVNTLKPWLSDFVERAQDAPKPDWLGGFIQRFRSGFVIAKLAGNVPSLAGQASDVFKPIFAPGISNLELMRAYTSLVRHPKDLVTFIKEKSPNEMRHREETFNREIRDILTSRDLFDKSRHLTASFLMEGFRAMDAAVTYPAWLSVYRKGMDTHGNEAQAVREADRVIARTFQAGDPRNMSAVFRNRNIWARLFTTFMNDGNTWYGIISSSVASKDVPRISGALMGAFVSQAVFQMLKNRGPGDKKDEKEWLIEQAILTPAGSLPFLGDAISMGLMGNGKGDAFSGAMGQSFGSAIKPLMRDDMDPSEIVMSELDAFGTWGGIPGTSQVLRSWKYQHKVHTGEETPETATEATINTIFGKNPND